MAATNRNNLTNRRTALTAMAAASTSAILAGRSTIARAKEEDAKPELRIGLESQESQRWKFGLKLSTTATCTNVIATFPVPMDWPEQKVDLVEQNIDPLFRGWRSSVISGGAKQIVVRFPQLRRGSQGEISFVLDISRSKILPPEKTDDLVAPKRIPREVMFAMGNSPHIDASHGMIKAASRELKETTHETAWEQVEAIYDYVRAKVEYTNGKIKNASQALRDGTGDCEEMTSLFVALCRNARIPARMVWIPGHCYPEFYLEDAEKNGHWFPCQAAGTRQFGHMDEDRPIFQKGDKFRVPDKKSAVRYVSETFNCEVRGQGQPSPTFIQEQVFDS